MRWVPPKGGRSRRKLKKKVEKLKARVEELEAEITMLRTTLRLGDESTIFLHRDEMRGEIRIPIPKDWYLSDGSTIIKNGKKYRVIVVERELRSILEEQ
jgi:hypothetical protein